MNELYEKMLSAYDQSTEAARRNAIYEVSQQIVLAGLADGGFFDKAAFYGGTCLRIFHGLNRFSEDMDFTLLKKDESFSFEQYFQPIIDQFAMVGRVVEITKKDKKSFGKVESAFLKDTTDVYNLSFQTEKSIKVKIEVDTAPPLKFATEQKLLLQPKSFMTRCVTLPCLFAGKMSALVFRAWKTRIKGRDWYDFEWYVRNGVPLDWNHLQERICESVGQEMTLDQFHAALRERLAMADISQVKADVLPFLNNPHETDIWSNEYFLLLSDQMKIRV
ncbi:MAG: nucleotidyl transferase AbiEii/AbiGii toxin family protein [Bacteroidales bacterium]|jgi:predicted nucleotidyltransferase component of viral defense system|nr:nucleotidyl transferase AbiEii/AbiGii toxin family protein [Bacteroidales bacterium]